MIEIKGVNKYYNNGKGAQLHVLKNVTLTLPEKGMVAVFGRSGCGKTTLLNVIGGLDGFSSGSVSINGKQLKDHLDRTRNKEIGYVFQNYCLHPENNCFDNVADALRLCGVKDEKLLEERTLKALALVGMEKYALRLPDTLSGGQQQRIAIARAIVKSPRIILADEPTGNLDEANTILIMDLLKKLSKDRLVVLVTHEADLVDHYCDRVVEILDGKIAGVKENKNADGLVSKKKNHIYLGELTKHTEQTPNSKLEFYGDIPQEGLSLRMVRQHGKTYLQILSPDVQVLDDSCEIRLVEGVFHEQAKQEEQKEPSFDLPAVNGTRYGKLFSFGSSLLAGYKIHFTKMRKKGRRMLVLTMLLLSLILVMTISSFGTAFADLAKERSSYNKNTFFLQAEQESEYLSLGEAVGKKESAIDYVFPRAYYYTSPMLMISAFETGDYTAISIESGADPVLSDSIVKDKALLCGRRIEKSNEILLSKLTAERILEQSTVSFLEKEGDLLHTRICYLDPMSNTTYTVVGVVDTDETGFFLSDLSLARHAPFSTAFLPGSEYGVTVKEGEAILYTPRESGALPGKYPKIGETIYLNGMTLTVTDTVSFEEIKKAEGAFQAFGEYNNQTGVYEDFYTPFNTGYTHKGAGFFVSDSDVLAACKTAGACSEPMEVEIDDSYIDSYVPPEYEGRILIHSTSPKITRQYLAEHFSSALTEERLTDPSDTTGLYTVLDGASVLSKLLSMVIFSCLSD